MSYVTSKKTEMINYGFHIILSTRIPNKCDYLCVCFFSKSVNVVLLIDI